MAPLSKYGAVAAPTLVRPRPPQTSMPSSVGITHSSVRGVGAFEFEMGNQAPSDVSGQLGPAFAATLAPPVALALPPFAAPPPSSSRMPTPPLPAAPPELVVLTPAPALAAPPPAGFESRPDGPLEPQANSPKDRTREKGSLRYWRMAGRGSNGRAALLAHSKTYGNQPLRKLDGCRLCHTWLGVCQSLDPGDPGDGLVQRHPTRKFFGNFAVRKVLLAMRADLPMYGIC
jgi:hypothetical protein